MFAAWAYVLKQWVRLCEERVFVTVARGLRAACLSTFLVFAAGSTQASEGSGPMSEAFEACGQSDSIRDDAFKALLAGHNWLRLYALSKGQRVLLTDGILASMSTSRDQLIDWQASAQSAVATTKTLSEILRSKNARAFYKTDPPSLLIALAREGTAEFDQFQCIFAGQIDGEFQKALDAMSRADKTAGIEQANAGLDIFNIRMQATNGSDPPRATGIDAQIGFFTANILPDLNHKPRAQVGFSLFHYTQK